MADINHHICEGITHLGIFLLALSDNLIYEDWFFAESCFMFFVSVPQYLFTERFSEDSNRFVKGDKIRHVQMCINKKRLARFEHC